MKTIEEMNTKGFTPEVKYSYYDYGRTGHGGMRGEKVVEKESEYELNARVIADYFGLTKRSVAICRGQIESWGDKLDRTQYMVYVDRTLPDGKRMPTMEIRFTASAHDHEIGRKAGKDIHPSWYSLLACVTKSDPETFEDFCASYGYDTDSRKAEKVYRDVVKEYHDFKALFPEGIPEEIMEIS